MATTSNAIAPRPSGAGLSFAELDQLAGGRIGIFDAPCPECGPGRREPRNRIRPVLRVWRSADHVRFYCARCGSSGAASANAGTQRGQRRPQAPVGPREPVRIVIEDPHLRGAETAEDAGRRRAALDRWVEGLPPARTIVEDYLSARGLDAGDTAGAALRFHPRLRCGDGWTAGMVALFRDIISDKPVGIGRTFLDGTGRKLGRKMLGPVRDAAIKLTPDGEVTGGLGITEGAETGLAVLGSGWRPIWALGSAGAIARFPVLAIEALTIFADADPAGLEAAKICARRWAASGREARILRPPEVGDDWNDVVRDRVAP